MTSADTELIAPPTKLPRLHSLWHTLTSMYQGLRARYASTYTWGQEWVVELQEVIGRAYRAAIISLTTIIVGRFKEPLFWLRFAAILCTLMGGVLRMVEPDTWLGRPFASRFEAAKAGYQTLLQWRWVHVTAKRSYRLEERLTRNDPGFHEILELALANAPKVREAIATDQFGPIETIYASIDDRPMFAGRITDLLRSTTEHPFRSPLPVRLENRQGESHGTILDYTERDLKERFFMPKLHRWATVVSVTSFIAVPRGATPGL